jgi:hypothetical protein
MPPVVVVTLAVDTRELAEAIAAAIGEAGALLFVGCGGDGPGTAIVLSARAADVEWVAEGGPGAVPG